MRLERRCLAGATLAGILVIALPQGGWAGQSNGDLIQLAEENGKSVKQRVDKSRRGAAGD